jgi:hypothetical protein
MPDWISVNLASLSHEEPQRQDRAHSFRHAKGTSIQFCRYCGHVPLKNAISVLVTRVGCGYESDLRFQNWVRTGRL